MKKSNILLVILIFFISILSILVTKNYTSALDNYIYEFVISFKNDFLTNFFKIITEFGDIKVILIIILISLFSLRGLNKFLPIITVIDVQIINLLLKAFFQRNRPNILQLVVVDNYSYPSGHSMMSMGLYGLLIYISWKNIKNKKIKYITTSILSLLIISIGVSRIYLGVHYFTDVIGGFAVSLCYLIILDKVIRKWDEENEYAKINCKWFRWDSS